MFTGKAPFGGETIAEIKRLQEQSDIRAPSTWAPDLDASVDRAILRCLAPDATKRPPSALALMASLPGGDPLAEALAAGEIPSPELVAASGETYGMSVGTACALLAFILCALAAMVVWVGKVNVLRMTPFERPPDVLEQTARDLIQRFGYTKQAADRAYGFNWDADYEDYAERQEKLTTHQAQLAQGQPTLIYFWYRQSPQYLETVGSQGVVSETDPPSIISDMVSLRLDPQGRLVQFNAVPPQVAEISQAEQLADWAAVFGAAGLDMARFQSSDPQWLPLSSFDSRRAWIGSHPHAPEVPIRIEAASWRGRLVSFQVIGPWSKPDRMKSAPRGISLGIGWSSVGLAVFAVVVGMAILLAYRSLRLGRGNIRGATRLGVVILSAKMLAWLLSAHHSPTQYELESLLEALGSSLFAGGAMWALYIGVEPYIRRRWPQSMISWSRLLDGRFRDPLVGAHVLAAIGFSLGVAMLLLIRPTVLLRHGFLNTKEPGALALASLLGVPSMASWLLATLVHQVEVALTFFLLFFVFKVLLRNEWISAVVIFALYIAYVRGSGSPVIPTVFLSPLALFILVRFGVLTMALAPTLTWSLLASPLSPDSSSWYAGSNILILLVMVALTAYAFHTAIGGRPLLKAEFFESARRR